MKDKTTIIAVCGKGGVGKTSISSIIVKLLIEKRGNAKILAIDADPAMGLSSALGVEVNKTVDDIRQEVADTARGSAKEDAVSLLAHLDYEVFESLSEEKGFAFLAIGRPESEGCYCGVNSYLKKIISELANNFDYVIIDCEAGIEQVNRRVIEEVTHLLLVSDTSRKGSTIIRTISGVADRLALSAKKGVIINRIRDDIRPEDIDPGGLNVLAFVPEDRDISLFDAAGKSLLGLSGTVSVRAVERSLINFGIV